MVRSVLTEGVEVVKISRSEGSVGRDPSILVSSVLSVFLILVSFAVRLRVILSAEAGPGNPA